MTAMECADRTVGGGHGPGCVCSNQSDTIVEEWRVTGEPGQGYPSYSFTWRSSDSRWPTLGEAEAAARAFAAQFPKMWEEMPGLEPWTEGPTVSHRTVTYTAWDEL